jgi:hypothetical protein
MKRTAIEIADFERDVRRLKDMSKDLADFGRLFREFWDKVEDKQLGPGKVWEKTKNIRHQGLTFWKLPVLQLINQAKGTTIGLGSYRFTGHRVPFLVSMVVLLRMDLRMEFNKASQRAAQRAAKDLGRIGNELSDDEESDALPIDLAPLDAMKRVTESLSGLLPLLVADAPTDRAFTQDKLGAGRKSLADAMGDPEMCGAIFRALDSQDGQTPIWVRRGQRTSRWCNPDLQYIE